MFNPLLSYWFSSRGDSAQKHSVMALPNVLFRTKWRTTKIKFVGIC